MNRCLWLFLVALFLVGVCPGQEARRVTLRRQDLPIRSAVYDVALQAGVHVRYGEGVDLVKGSVEIDAVDQPFAQVLELILASARPRLAVRREGDEYVVYYKEPVVSYNPKPVRDRTVPVTEVIDRFIEQSKVKIEVDIEDGTTVPNEPIEPASLSDALRLLGTKAEPPFVVVDDEGVPQLLPKESRGDPSIAPQPGHSGTVIATSFSDDGTLLASSDSGGYTNVWDVSTGKTIRTVGGVVGDEAFTADRKEVVAAVGNLLYAARIDQKRYRVIAYLPRPVKAIAFSPKAGIAVVDDGVEISAHDIYKKTRLNTFRVRLRPWVFALSLDGEHIAIGFPKSPGAKTNHIDYGEVRSGRIVPLLYDGTPVQIAFTRGDRALVVSDSFGEVSLQSVNGYGIGLAVPRANARKATPVRVLAVSRDGALAAYRDEARRVVIRDVQTERAVRIIPAIGSQDVTTLAFDPSGRQILVGRQTFEEVSPKLTLYAVSNGLEARRFTGGTDRVRFVRFASDGRFLVAGHPGGFRVWDPSMWTGPTYYACGPVTVKPQLDPSDPLELLGTQSNGRMFRWLPEKGRREPVPGSLGGRFINEVVWSASGNQVVTRDRDDRVRVWLVGGSKPVAEIAITNRPIHRMLVNENASRIMILSGEAKLQVSLWDGTNSNLVDATSGGEKLAISVAGASMGPYAAISINGELRVVRWADGKPAFPKMEGTSPSFSADGKILAYQAGDRTVVLDLSNRKVVIESPPQHFFPETASDGNSVVSYNRERTVAYVYAKGTSVTLAGHEGQITSVDAHPTRGLLASSSLDGTVRLWDLKGKELARLVGIGREDFLAVGPDNVYMASPVAARKQTFERDGKTFPFEQFDLMLNRPDLVMESIGIASPEHIEIAHKAYLKRLKSVGMEQSKLATDIHTPATPRLKQEPIGATKSASLQLSLELHDPLVKLASLHILVNGVPIDGMKGRSLQSLDANRIRDYPVALALSRGLNQVQISVRNAQGVSSAKRVFTVTRNDPAPFRPNLYVLSVGVSDYRRYGPLPMASRDAVMVADLLRSLQAKAVKQTSRRAIVRRQRRRRRTVMATVTSITTTGTYGRVEALVLPNGKATLASISKARSFLAKAGIDDVVVLFFSGHGTQDTDMEYYYIVGDTDPKDLPNTAFSYSEIQKLIDGIASRKKLVILDTCGSGKPEDATAYVTVVKDDKPARKGVAYRSGEAPIPVVSAEFGKMLELFSDLETSSGASVIAAVVGAGRAEESRALGNGAMTYALIDAIRRMKGDFDRNSRITVGELRRYLADAVPKLTDDHQKPTFREENPNLDFAIR